MIGHHDRHARQRDEQRVAAALQVEHVDGDARRCSASGAHPDAAISESGSAASPRLRALAGPQQLHGRVAGHAHRVQSPSRATAAGSCCDRQDHLVADGDVRAALDQQQDEALEGEEGRQRHHERRDAHLGHQRAEHQADQHAGDDRGHHADVPRQALLVSITASTAAHTPLAKPADRSISPSSSTNTRPMAITVTAAPWVNRLAKLPAVRNDGPQRWRRPCRARPGRARRAARPCRRRAPAPRTRARCARSTASFAAVAATSPGSSLTSVHGMIPRSPLRPDVISSTTCAWVTSAVLTWAAIRPR